MASQTTSSEGGDPHAVGPRDSEVEDNAQAHALAAWRAGFGLERWLFLARGVGDQVTPLALDVDGEGVICVFTTTDRARDFGLSLGLSTDDVATAMAMTPGDAVDYLLQFAGDGVRAAVLDPGTTDAAVMLAALPHVRELAKEG